MLKLSCWPLAFVLHKALFKNRKITGTTFLREKCLTLFTAWLLLLLEILGNVYIAIICRPGCDVINFEIDLSYQTDFLDDQTSILRTKRTFKMK